MRETISFVVAVEVIQRVPSPSHYPVKLLEVEHAIAISVRLLQHFLELIVGYLLADLRSDSLQIFEGDLVEVILIEQFEDLQYFVFGVSWALGKQSVTMREVMTDWNSLKLSPSLISLPMSA